jgi:hypothetical protein
MKVRPKRLAPVPNVLSGIVYEVGEGFIVLNGGTRITVSSRISSAGLIKGTRVRMSARPLGSEWVAEEIAVED